jgi:hypothetical protein
MAAKPLIKCSCCGGSGRTELPAMLQKGFESLSSLNIATVAEFSRFNGSELTASHHLMRRLVLVGVAERVAGSAPAKYRALKRRGCKAGNAPRPTSAV